MANTCSALSLEERRVFTECPIYKSGLNCWETLCGCPRLACKKECRSCLIYRRHGQLRGVMEELMADAEERTSVEGDQTAIGRVADS